MIDSPSLFSSQDKAHGEKGSSSTPATGGIVWDEEGHRVRFGSKRKRPAFNADIHGSDDRLPSPLG